MFLSLEIIVASCDKVLSLLSNVCHLVSCPLKITRQVDAMITGRTLPSCYIPFGNRKYYTEWTYYLTEFFDCSICVKCFLLWFPYRSQQIRQIGSFCHPQSVGACFPILFPYSSCQGTVKAVQSGSCMFIQLYILPQI